MSGLRRVAVVLPLVALSTVALAGPAHAAPTTVVEIPSGEVHFVAGDGQANRVTVTKLSGFAHRYRFTDAYPITFNDIYPVSAGACTYPYAGVQTTLDCDHQVTIISVRTLDQGDTIDYRVSVSWQLEGGDGPDVIRTGTGAGNPAYYTTGGGGDDLIYSGPGDEYISGGTGIDTVSYVGRWAAITATAGVGGGEAGEQDGYAGIENVVGGAGNDTIVGSNEPNVLDGGYASTPCPPTPGVSYALPPCTSYSGNDNLSGGGGADTLIGRSGDDILAGGAGFDTLDAGSGSDWCYLDADSGTKTNCEYPLIWIPF